MSHSEITVASLEGGKHVMCEKPMAINYAEAKKMLDMVQAKIIGVIYNGKKQGDDSYYYYGAEGTK